MPEQLSKFYIPAIHEIYLSLNQIHGEITKRTSIKYPYTIQKKFLNLSRFNSLKYRKRVGFI